MAIKQDDIARMLGIGRATVSRVMNGHPDVDEGVRQRVLDLSRNLGYSPNYAARSLSGRKTKAVSLIWSGTMHETLHQWTELLHASAASRGYKFRLERTEDVETVTSEVSCDGFICFGMPNEVVPQDDAFIKGTRRPVVYTDCQVGIFQYNTVSVDNPGGSALAVAHLTSLGHTRIAFVGLTPQGVSKDRYAGYVRAMNDARLTAPGDWTLSLPEWPKEPKELMPYIPIAKAMIHDGVSAFLAASDVSAVGMMWILRELGITVPGDISIVGWDDTLLSRAWLPNLTVVVQDLAAASGKTLDMLISLIENKESRPSEIVESRLVVRDSSGPFHMA